MNDVPTAECASEYNRNNSAKVVLAFIAWSGKPPPACPDLAQIMSKSRNLWLDRLSLRRSRLQLRGRRRDFVRRVIGWAGRKTGGGRIGGGQFRTREPRANVVAFLGGVGVARRRDDRKPGVGFEKVFRQPKAPREQNRQIILAIVNAIFGRFAKPQSRARIIGLAAFGGEHAEIMHGAGVTLLGRPLIQILGALHVRADTKTFFVKRPEPVFRHGETLLRRLLVPLRSQFIISRTGAPSACFEPPDRTAPPRRRIRLGQRDFYLAQRPAELQAQVNGPEQRRARVARPPRRLMEELSQGL